MKQLIKNWINEYKLRYEELKAAAPDVWKNLQEGIEQLAPSNIYASKTVGAVASFRDLFKADDAIAIGLTNISNGAPQKGEHHLVCAVSLQYVIAGGATEADVKAAAFNLINTNMRNGEIEISQNKRVILGKQLMDQFYNADKIEASGDTNAAAATPITYTMEGYGNVGLVEITPKWLEPERLIDVSMDFAAAMGSANVAVRIILHTISNVKV